ncbi:type 4b pilus protein PilO2 [Janthinobacterium agaricidamnosum]|uniref:Type IV Tfp pilus assembly PilO protein n=1 Tax=Janthinobacterium agaricidamnosum NBRC 102515 = DSM 9628 TaxID=1349767 RepID=W0V4Y8_9BURK|nr:type 4b pilus protein PilO2 [Janthinobacterium agaricidamnosum]CDG82337.1 type IV Tfp pilus assembly PilO protein [Janthinobacterium agaricidamnosum NBRC 102515 = DSM 9628]
MSIYLTHIGKHQFCSGLFWQSLSRPRELLKEARDLALKIDFDQLVLRKEYATAQAGFAHGAGDGRSAVYSLALAVSSALARQGAHYDGENQPAHNWLAAFRLPDGMWAYFAVRDANFLPNGDFAGSREEVLERLHGDYGLGGWNLVIGDAELEDYGFHNFIEKGILDLLEEKGGKIKVSPQWALRPLRSQLLTRRRVALGGAVILALCALAGIKIYRDRAEQERQRLAIVEAQRQLHLQQLPPPAPLHPWASLPPPALLAETCNRYPRFLASGGWALDGYACDGHAVQYGWLRQDASLDSLLAQVAGAVPDLNGERATYTQPLPALAGRDEALLPYQELMAPILSRLQLMHVNMKVVKAPQPPAVNGVTSADPNGTLMPLWNTYSYMINTSDWQPVELAAILDQPGIRINTMNFRGDAWTIEGTIYAK